MIRARNNEHEVSLKEQEGSLWSAYEEYMRGDRDLESLDQIEEKYDDVSLLPTPTNGLMHNLLNFMDDLFH